MKLFRSFPSCAWRRAAPLSLAAAAIAVMTSGNQASTTAQGPEPCTVTSKLLRTSCKHEQKDDYWRMLSICRNLPTPQEREACAQQAAQDLHEALEECDEIFVARQEICEELGGGIYHPVIEPANFVAHITHPYLPFVPGTTHVYEGRTGRGLERIEVFVTHQTKVIQGVTCTEVRDTAFLDGDIIEDTLDWFAQDLAGNVWYFGENSKEFDEGLIVSLDGSWTAGEDGAKAGIIMRAQPVLGELYRQEFALGDAEDVARVIAIGLSGLTVPFGTFDDCWQSEEFSPFSSGVEFKYYAPDIGLIRELNPESGEVIELIDILHE